MKLKMYCRNDQSAVECTPALRGLCRRAVHAALTYEKVEFDCEVSLTFTDNEGIRELNREYRGRDRATDVLSFPMYDFAAGEEPDEIGDFVTLGDIVVSLERARSQAEEYGHSFEREMGFLAVHGFLHINGYDHYTPEEEKEMFGLQEEILTAYGLTRQ